ncbi:DinB family protein [Virgibacillus halophilus]|uniref:DinB family protein n=1 Tax=Tigheibacillus halophilus TaxID=361280 RepID=A0ABU5CA23_9BACI|nr:DinB family protein [Virgibacillus halophilus]
MRCERIKALQATVAKVEVLRCIPDAMLTEPIRTGKWSIREIIGHMYYWDKYNVEKMIPEMRNHAILPAFPDHDSHNAEAIRYIDTFDSLERIIDVFIHTRKALVQALSYVDSDITFLYSR